MAGLLDLFGGGDQSNGGGLLGLYGGDDSQPQIMDPRQAGLLGFLAGMQRSGALNYTAPFLSGKVPAGFAAGLAGGAGGLLAGQAQALQAAKTQAETGKIGAETGKIGADTELTKLQIPFAQQKLGLLPRFMQILSGGMPNTAGPSTAGPGPQGGAPSADAASLTPNDLVGKYESEALAKRLGISPYNIGVGGTDLSTAQLDENGFPIWEGNGASHAAGRYQFQPATWAQYAPALGVKDFSPESQDKIFRAAYLDQGYAPWAPFNPALRAALANGAGIGSGGSASATADNTPGGGDLPARIGLSGNGPNAQSIDLDTGKPVSGLNGATSSPGIAAGDNGQPFRPGLLAPPAPASGLLAQSAAQTPPTASPAASPVATAAAAPSGGLLAGGGITGMSPQRLFALSAMGDLLGFNSVGQLLQNTPEYAGAKAAAVAGNTAAAQHPFKMEEERQSRAEQGQQERQTKAFEAGLNPLNERNKVLAEEYKTDVMAPSNAAQKALVPLDQISNAMENFRTGPSAGTRLALKRAWQDFSQGVGLAPDSDLAKEIASGEIINKSGTTLGFDLARTLGSREAQMIVTQAIKTNPGLENSPQGNRQLIALIRQGLQRDVDKRSFYDEYFNRSMNYDGAFEAFNKAKPVESYVSKVLPYSAASPAEAAKLPPGTIFKDPTGTLRMVPQGNG